MIGRTLSHYTIETHLGRGGMGEVWGARDVRLGRMVAVKILPRGVEESGIRRFVTEAKAASALNHPNIVTIHDIGRDGEIDFIVMEKIDGQPLSAIAQTPMAVDRFLDIAVQITSALAAAHAAGIVHRDIKPGNVMVTPSGTAKVVDFGLARLGAAEVRSAPDDPTEAMAMSQPVTRDGAILGTAGYISPEQLQGARAGDRSDVFSLGVMFYELLAGRSPFRSTTPLATVAAILRDTPQPLDGVPRALDELIQRCMAKDPASRPSAADVHAALLSIRDAAGGEVRAPRAHVRRLAAAAITLLLIVIVAGALWWRRASRLGWARNAARQEIERLLEIEDPVAAYAVAKKAMAIAPDDSQVQQTWANLTFPITIRSNPPGAEVSIRSYKTTSDWISLGRTPLVAARIPFPLVRLRLTRDGYASSETAPEIEDVDVTYRLFRARDTPDGMVPVAGGRASFLGQTVELPDYWIDRYEVTNAEYKRFIEAGGYRRRELWKHPFVRDGRRLSWEEAIGAFVDRTGRPGPSGWELGSYPEGAERHPVAGISWYEAAAFAELAGKSLPTVFHWQRAAKNDSVFSDVLALSNFAGKGTTPAGSLEGLGQWGTYDMAGNVKEWCFNPAGQKRYALGGSWSDASWQYREPDGALPMDRPDGFGFRLMRTAAPPPGALLAEVLEPPLNKAKPVDDATFAVYARMYDYDPTPLEARVEQADDSHAAWRKERVSFAAAYGRERVPAYLFLPKNARPPYQTIVFFPGSDAVFMTSSRELWLRMVEFYIRSGRAVVYPVIQGTYERQVRVQRGPIGVRELRIQRAKDIRRTVDYLMTRDDIDRQRIAFYGASLGANNAALTLAVDHRFRTAILFGGGLRAVDHLPEVRQENFLPRVKTPTLLVGGRYDFQFPLETAQKPLFDLLGAPPDQKRHVVLDGGHIPTRFNDAVKEMLAWTDRWMGPVGEQR
ncbi:MAG: protein kinase [Acidobacteriota bacterium]